MKEITETVETFQIEIPLTISSERNLARIENISLEAHQDLASVTVEANNLERLRQEEEERRRAQERITLERQFSQD